MAPIFLGRLVLWLQGRCERHGRLLAGELRGCFQLQRARPEISPFGRSGWFGPCHASLRRESDPAIEVGLLFSHLLPYPPYYAESNFARWLTWSFFIEGRRTVSHCYFTQARTAGPRHTWSASPAACGTLLPCPSRQILTPCTMPPLRQVEYGSESAASSSRAQEPGRTVQEYGVEVSWVSRQMRSKRFSSSSNMLR